MYFTDYQNMNLWKGSDRRGQRNLRNILRASVMIFTILGGSICFLPTAAAYANPTSGLPRAGIVLRSFDKPEHNWLPGHRGVDLPLGIGGDVLSAGDGVVAFAGMVVGTPTVSIDHPDGVRTTYQPVHADVSVGDLVLETQKIGTLGHPTTPYPGLQWGAKTGEDYLNPIRLLPAPSIRLKPVMPADEPG